MSVFAELNLELDEFSAYDTFDLDVWNKITCMSHLQKLRLSADWFFCFKPQMNKVTKLVQIPQQLHNTFQMLHAL